MLVLLATSFWSEREATSIGRMENSGPSAQSAAAAHAAFMARVTSHRSTLSGMGLSHGQPRFWLSGTLCDSFPQHCHAHGIMLCGSDRHALPSVVSGSDIDIDRKHLQTQQNGQGGRRRLRSLLRGLASWCLRLET